MFSFFILILKGSDKMKKGCIILVWIVLLGMGVHFVLGEGEEEDFYPEIEEVEVEGDEETVCRSSVDCEKGEFCANGKCTEFDADEEESCTSDDDCESNYRCNRKGICVKNSLFSPSLFSIPKFGAAEYEGGSSFAWIFGVLLLAVLLYWFYPRKHLSRK